ncbi:PREDICTED: probable protein phosphatase 2C 24 [Populus euphratica]|uniref:protein-serine/threonine phosphatase n=1 Tax=Populus euphratica TaxID=75702 RepID=A0AAJ6ULK9_POPEU|nr:PREDICTED: probable protein phosphatase 2C 24 [Populus euphratica]
MADICCGVARENEASSTPCEPTSRAARRRRMEIRRFKFVPGVASTEIEADDIGAHKKQKLQNKGVGSPFPRDCQNAVENCFSDHCSTDEKKLLEIGKSSELKISRQCSLNLTLSPSILSTPSIDPLELFPKFGVASVCGRRRDMEDAVAIHPSFCRKDQETTTELHYFGVYDGHGCSHVAVKCKERMHELVKEEVESKEEWKSAMERSFRRMDKEVIAWNQGMEIRASCRCEMQTPECDAVGSTAVVAVVTPDKIVVANCGDSRAVLCRNGKPLPLSSDHKPDRPDELKRIQNAGGRVIYWDGPRILGVLAMSRAIGDNYLKPYVSCEPEVTIMDRTAEDDCLILASDGLWDVVSNETACGVARMCLRAKEHAPPPCPPRSVENNEVLGITSSSSSSGSGEMSDKACSDASMLLTKLALARHSTDNVSVVVVDLRKDT